MAKHGKIGIIDEKFQNEIFSQEFEDIIVEDSSIIDNLNEMNVPIVLKSIASETQKKSIKDKLFTINKSISGKYMASEEEPGRIKVKCSITQDFSAPINGKSESLADPVELDVESSIMNLGESEAGGAANAEISDHEGLQIECYAEKYVGLDAKTTAVSKLYIEEDTSVPQVVIHKTEVDQKHNQPIGFVSSPTLPKSTPVPVVLPSVTSFIQLMVTVIEAKGLYQVQKFGVQTPLIELKIGMNGSPVRTFGQKKGGSNGEWNQNFVLNINNLQDDELYLYCKTSNNVVIGESRIPCKSLSCEYADSFFKIYRPNSVNEAGEVRMQLRIIDKHNQPAPITPVVSGTMEKEEKKPPRHLDQDSHLRKGSLLYKIPFHSVNEPKRTWVCVKEDGQDKNQLVLQWTQPQETVKSKSIYLSDVYDLKRGHYTDAFIKQIRSNNLKTLPKAEVCFSLITSSRTVDLACSSVEEANEWFNSLSNIILNTESDLPVNKKVSDEYKLAALSPRPEFINKRRNSRNNMDKKDLSIQQLEWMNNLFVYARNNLIAKISELIAEGCPIDLMETGSGDTILMIACRNGYSKLVDMCLTWRAKNDPHPDFGETALQAAVCAQNASCAESILNEAEKSTMDSIIVNHVDPRGDAPIHVSSGHGDMKCLEVLINHGADLSSVDSQGRTALHRSAIMGHTECLNYLLDVGIDSSIDAGDYRGDTALHYAASVGSILCVKTLLESAANTQQVDGNGFNAYDLAKANGHIECMELIAKYYNPGDTNTPYSRCLKPGEKKASNPPAKDYDLYFATNNASSHHPPLNRTYSSPILAHKNQINTPRQAVTDRSAGPALISARTQIRTALSPTNHRYYQPKPVKSQPRCSSNSPSTFLVSPRQTMNGSYDDYSGYNSEYQPRTSRYHHKGSTPQTRSKQFEASDDPYYSDSSGPSSHSFKTNHYSTSNHYYNYQQAEASPYHYSSPAVHEISSPQAWTTHEWETYYTENGDPYYYNNRTGTSQWELPQESKSFFSPQYSQNNYYHQEVPSPTMSARSRIRLALSNSLKHTS